MAVRVVFLGMFALVFARDEIVVPTGYYSIQQSLGGGRGNKYLRHCSGELYATKKGSQFSSI